MSFVNYVEISVLLVSGLGLKTDLVLQPFAQARGVKHVLAGQMLDLLSLFVVHEADGATLFFHCDGTEVIH